MVKFLNISNHNLTDEQVNDLKKNIFKSEEVKIVELPKHLKEVWGQLNPSNYEDVCNEISKFIVKERISYCHLAGFAPAVVYLCQLDIYNGLSNDVFFFYSFSERVSEEKEINGEVIKTSKFQHKGWYRY